MKGQWLGEYAGTNTGQIVVDLDERSDHFEGYAHLVDNRSGYPISFAYLKTSDKSNQSIMDVAIRPVDPITAEPVDWSALAARYPGFIFPTSAKVTFDLKSDFLDIEWVTDIGTRGAAHLPKSKAGEASGYTAQKMDWDYFKKYVDVFGGRRYIFRGQEKSWKLRTSFHRTQRANLARFITEDIPALHRVLSSRTRHIYDLKDPDQNGAFYHLIQHHGYPTPLLDWSYSPFVAAFFAFRKISAATALNAANEDRVRIFVMDQQAWRNDFNQIHMLRTYAPHFSIMEFIAIDNDRMVPQQALSCVTNIDDVEAYISVQEIKRAKTYLQMIDLPIKERAKVIADLGVMGITAGSMFPGVDGACEEIRERLFTAR